MSRFKAPEFVGIRKRRAKSLSAGDVFMWPLDLPLIHVRAKRVDPGARGVGLWIDRLWPSGWRRFGWCAVPNGRLVSVCIPKAKQ